MGSGVEQLKDWIARRGFNQTQAAEYLGFDNPYLSQLINGKRSPGLANAVKIEEKTGIPVEAWLIEVDDSVVINTAESSKAQVNKA